MSYILLLHWHEEEAEERAERIRAWGHEVHILSGGDAKSLKPFVEEPPAASVVDLDRLPSQGREIGSYLRRRKTTRRVPLVFVGGREDKVARTRHELPDATFTDWQNLESVLDSVLSAAPLDEDPFVPSAMGAYSGTPLAKKLGIKAEDRVALLGAPKDFEALLQPLPEGVQTRRRGDRSARMVILFVKSRRQLDRRFAGATKIIEEGGSLWIAWPKKASGLESDLTQQIVRDYGLDRELVDYKIAAIDATWSGLRFARRPARRAPRERRP